ncbi:30S ribosomal protein S3 [Candidatus Poribacteria bacterium]|nr:30S ribosomal protein S3 [Candidatus Poribacteria bacterium]
MGQKTHPRGLRLGIIENWDSKWYNEKEYAQWLHEDLKIQSFIKERLSRAGISRIEIERVGDRCNIHIHTARPGIVIGRRGVEAEKLQADLEHILQTDSGSNGEKTVRINVTEIKRPELDAQLVAEAVALQIVRRSNFRQAMKKSIIASMKAGAQGAKISIGGRLGGAEMARSESNIEGRVPLHTLRANIDYGFAEADTTYGKIGIKTWIFKGEIIGRPELPGTGSPSSRAMEVPTDSSERRPARFSEREGPPARSEGRPRRRRDQDRRRGPRRTNRENTRS